jgi:S-formylglutathione hydrolase FrmB
VAVARFLLTWAGIAEGPPPWPVWGWTATAGFAFGVAVSGWPGSSWWRRNVLVFAFSACLLSTGLVINGWIGYFPTVSAAWDQLTDRPLPGQTDLAVATAMRARGEIPATGRIVDIGTGDAHSGFRHRREWVYLPPVWFSPAVRTELPTVMMIGGEFNTPADWIRVGGAVATTDAYAVAHHGWAPVLVFVDPSGAFTVDTECVNGIRGNAADHLTMDVIPFVISTFGVSREGRHWAVAGFSSGGTCALDLAVLHPDLFGSFVDIAGEERPTAGTEDQTVQRLFGGDRSAWAAFDPATVISRHDVYRGLSGIFVVPETGSASPTDDAATAHRLCALGASKSLECSVESLPGHHDWPFARAAFAATLPRLVARLQTPSVATG